MSLDAEMNWLRGFLSGNLFSHPGKRLLDHLEGVARLCEKISQGYSLPIDHENLLRAALTHDLGKAHPEFQKYLDLKGPGINHAETSSWHTYLLAKNILVSEAVRRHHTHLKNSDQWVNDWLDDSVSVSGVNKTLKECVPLWPVTFSEKDNDELEDYFGSLDQQVDLWLELRLVYSVLIAADRMDALGISDIEIKKIPPFSRGQFNNDSEINNWREKTREFCLANLEKINQPGVYTLTLPTGAGKTLLGLEIAEILAKKFNCGSIIYALPFISIVEQNSREAKRVFGNVVQEDHSMVNLDEPKREQDFDLPWPKMMSLFRYWREPVVVTTMVQLWDVIFKPKANNSMNFHKLSRSVVILDEPQSIPPQKWQGLSDTLNYLSEKLRTTFIFMTATQPQIKAISEIAKVNEFPFNRHKYFVEEDIWDLEVLPEKLSAHVAVEENSGMIVLNTRMSALKAHKLLSGEISTAPVLFLSSWMTPYHRKKVLAKLRLLEKHKGKRYLVATQVVEAGVNLDFDWVFRDFGPLDSIIQAAGRCNRHFSLPHPGKVIVAKLSFNGKILAAQVYDDILLDASWATIPKNRIFDEKETKLLIEKYYAKIINDGYNSDRIFEHLTEGNWEKMGPLNEKSTYPEVDVIIEQNAIVRSLLNQLESHKWELENRHEKKRLMRTLQQFMIKIPEKYVSLCRRKCMEVDCRGDFPPFSLVMGGQAYFMSREAVQAGLYDEVTGFLPPTDDASGVIFESY